MFKKLINFIKYNNAMVLILAIILIFGTGAFAQTDAGQALIGEKEMHIEGVDNTLLLEADLDTLDMDFKIERIEEDDKYYYVTYTYLDLFNNGEAWLYQITEKVRKVSKKSNIDLGEYLAEELSEEYQALIKNLKAEQAKAEEAGEEVRLEVTEYSGLIGQTLEVTGKIFSDYEPVKKRVLPSPSTPPTVLLSNNTTLDTVTADDIADIYEEYVTANDPDLDDVFGVLDNCPNDPNPDQLDTDGDDIGDVCDPTPDGETPEEPATTTDEILEEATSTPEEVVEEEPAVEETVEEPVVEEPEVEIVEEPVVEETAPTEKSAETVE
jgi:hypothetical protein